MAEPGGTKRLHSELQYLGTSWDWVERKLKAG